MQLCFLSLFFLSAFEAHKILVYNVKFAHSHSNFLGNIADILVEAGHDVTSLIPEITSKIKDGTTKSKIVRVATHADAAATHEKFTAGEVDLFASNELDPIMMSYHMGFMFARQCEVVLDSGVVDKLRNEHFDVYIVEPVDTCGMMLAHLIQPRSILAMSTTILMGEHYTEFGVPLPLSYNPSSLTRSLDVHSFLSRSRNILADFISRLSFIGPRSQVGIVFRQRYGSDYPTQKEISSNVAYVFTNSEPLIDFATPTISKVIDIGGLGAKEPTELDEYWISVMTRRPKVVLISFGSIAKSFLLSPSVKDSLLKVVSAFPSVTFIWKYERKDEFALEVASKIDNLILVEWMPQNDLLDHSNLAVFITHGGMGSVQELAIRANQVLILINFPNYCVFPPAILIPIFGDQPRNAAMIEHNDLGKTLSKLDVGNHEKMIELLKELMENPQYAKNARRISRMLANKPFTSKEKLIKYVEFAAEFGPSSALRPQSLDMSTIEYYNLDIIFAALSMTLIVVHSLIRAIGFAVRSMVKVKKE